MATHYSPSIVIDDLVLMLDAANDKSFRGVPAVNCAKSLIDWNAESTRTITEVTEISPQRSGARIFKVVLTATVSNNRFSNYYSGGGFAGTATNPLILGKTGPNFTTVGSSIGNVKYRFGFWICGKSTNGSSYCAIDIGDRNYVAIGVSNNTNWQFISTDDSAGVNSDSYPYDFFDLYFSGSIGDTFYISDLMIVRSIGTVDSLPNLDSYPAFVDYQQTRGTTVATGGGWKNMISDSKHGTLSSTITYNSNNLGSLSFNGVDNVVTMGTGNDFFPLYNFTIDIWFKCVGLVPTTGDPPSLFGFTYGISCSVRTTDIFLYMDDGVTFNSMVTTGTHNYQDGNWYNAIFVNDGTTSFIYINGFLNNSSAMKWLGVSRWPTDGWNLGTNNNNVNYHFYGLIPSCKIYNRILTSTEVLQNFNSTKSRFGL